MKTTPEIATSAEQQPPTATACSAWLARPLATLRELAEEPIATVEELRRLTQQIDMAVGMIERNELIPMSERERMEHANRFGRGAFVVGDFVITRRWRANGKRSNPAPKISEACAGLAAENGSQIWKDKEDQWTAAIEMDHPLTTGDDKTYALALEMVGNRHSKYALVDLVNWLLRDKQRMDWLEAHGVEIGISALAYHEISPTREAIDRGMREISTRHSENE